MARMSGKPIHSSNVLLDLPRPNMDVFFKQWSYQVTGITWVGLLLETENVYCLPEGRGGLLVQHHMTSVGEFVLILEKVTSCNSVMEFAAVLSEMFIYFLRPAHVLKLFSLSFLSSLSPSFLLSYSLPSFFPPSLPSSLLVLSRGRSFSPCYRFMSRWGDWVWVRSKSYMLYNPISHLPEGISIYTWIVRLATCTNLMLHCMSHDVT